MTNKTMDYHSILESAEAEQTEKRSRFIARIIPFSHPDKLDQVLQQVRKDYPGATHYCWAYLIRGENNLRERYSDDGEPSGTAGLPILTVLKNSGLQDLMAVVVRYFGGTLLGTGGLVRAYTQAVQAALSNASTVRYTCCRHFQITIDYQFYGFFERVLRRYVLQMDDIQFASQVTIVGWIPLKWRDRFLFELKEATAGQAVIELGEEAYIPDLSA
ncbi:MAG TPA: YigZ family protein [Syntrophomonadaceae bacterium]|nr:YigZ family protein [Syntrophomonadaceae bacterium]